MGPPPLDWFRILQEVNARILEQQHRPPAPKRPFDSGRTMPRNEGLERAIKRTGGG